MMARVISARSCRVGSLAFALALSLVLGACGERRASSARGQPSAPEYRDVPIGLCEDHPPESTSDERIREDLQALRRAGVRTLRVSFGWDDLEPERDHYDYAPIDQVLRIAGELGVRLIPYVCYTPAWLAPKSAPERDIYRSPPTDVREFEQLMELLAARYQGRFASWELWNEPDNREYWLGTAAEYALLLKAGARGVKRGDPDARVVLGGIAGHLDFLEELLAEHDVASSIDIVNWHSYSETWSPEPLEGITPYLERAAELIEQHGEAEPLWLAEVGYSSFRRGNFVSDWYTARFAFEHTPEFQGSALLRVLAMARSVPEVELIAWYEVRDLPPGTEVIGDHNNRHLGVLDATGRPKPAFHSLTRAVTLLSGEVRPLEVQVRPSAPATAPRFEARAFQRADGRCLVVAWLPTQRLSAGEPPQPARARFALRARTSGDHARVLDAYGALLAEPKHASRDPIVTGELELSPERTHVLLIDGCR